MGEASVWPPPSSTVSPDNVGPRSDGWHCMGDNPSWKKNSGATAILKEHVPKWGVRGKMPQFLFEKLLWAARVQAVAAAPVQLCCGDSLCNPTSSLEGSSVLAKGWELGEEALEKDLCTPALGYCAIINIRTRRAQWLWCTWQGINLSWGCLSEGVLMLLFILQSQLWPEFTHSYFRTISAGSWLGPASSEFPHSALWPLLKMCWEMQSSTFPVPAPFSHHPFGRWESGEISQQDINLKGIPCKRHTWRIFQPISCWHILVHGVSPRCLVLTPGLGFFLSHLHLILIKATKKGNAFTNRDTGLGPLQFLASTVESWNFREGLMDWPCFLPED